jgi:tetratricopeptide (TPR) repeat protein
MAHNSHGIALMELKRFDAALESFNTAIALKRDYVEAHTNRGAAQHALGRYEQALATYDSAIALQPNFAPAFANRADTLLELDRVQDALASADRALALIPHYPEALNNRGRALNRLKRFDAAVASFERALAIRPSYVEALLNRGNAFTELERLDAAMADYDSAIALKPGLAAAFNGRALAFYALKRLDEALENYDKAIALDPHFSEALNNRAHALLAAGRMAEAWPDVEQRWNVPNVTWPKPAISAPEWSGENLYGQSILVYAEQGYGDIIQFSRYLLLLVAQGARVTFLAPPQLHRLFSGLSSELKIVSAADDSSHFDVQSALMSLPLHFKTGLTTIPAAVPYLTAEPGKIAFWKERIGPDGFRIGICWQANRAVMPGRSFPVQALQPLSQIARVRFISLQKGYGVEQLDHLAAGMKVETLGEDFDEGPDAFIDTAAVMQSLDLVITCDTSIAHLAGALARPAWVAMKFVPDWRWLLERTDSPWYPTLRLYRQATPGDWGGVFATMARDLDRLGP